jgi:hypothetical protein
LPLIYATITPPPRLFAADTPLLFRQLPLPFSYDAAITPLLMIIAIID